MLPIATAPAADFLPVPVIEHRVASAGSVPGGAFIDASFTSPGPGAAAQLGPRVEKEVFWLDMLSASARRLSALNPGWDGPGSVPISRTALFTATSLTLSALKGLDRAVAPYLVPGGDGSVQIEWHEKHGELELDVSPSGDLWIWGRDHITGAEYEGENDVALALFLRTAPRLAAIQVNVAHERIQEASTFLTFAA